MLLFASRDQSVAASKIFVAAVAVLIGAYASSEASAQGFDCRKATDIVDITICKTPTLASLDAQLGATWKNFQANHPERVRQAAAEGRAWYLKRKQCGQTPDVVGCIRDAEIARIRQLGGAVATDTPSASEGVASPAASGSAPAVARPVAPSPHQTDQHSTNNAGKVETANLAVLCPSLQDLVDLFKLINNGAVDGALSFAHQKKCQNVDEGVQLDVIERGPIISRVLMTRFTGILSVSTDSYFVRTTDLKK